MCSYFISLLNAIHDARGNKLWYLVTQRNRGASTRTKGYSTNKEHRDWGKLKCFLQTYSCHWTNPKRPERERTNIPIQCQLSGQGRTMVRNPNYYMYYPVHIKFLLICDHQIRNRSHDLHGPIHKISYGLFRFLFSFFL